MRECHAVRLLLQDEMAAFLIEGLARSLTVARHPFGFNARLLSLSTGTTSLPRAP